MSVDLESERTSVQITIKTRERLIRLGRKNDSYEDIIKKALDVYEKHLTTNFNQQ